MTASPNRIRSQRHVTAMVALDTVDLLAERVQQLLSHGRRVTMTRRYTYLDHAPEVLVGLHLAEEPKVWHRDDGAGFGVRLGPDLLAGFGFSAYGYEGSATEAEAWKRYHAGTEGGGPFERRRDMVYVTINGGLAGDGPARDDLLVIRAYNGDGVCDERVVAFDTGLLWEQRDAAAEVAR